MAKQAKAQAAPVVTATVYTLTGASPLAITTNQGSVKKATNHTGQNSRLTVVQAVMQAHPNGFTATQFSLVFNALKASGALTATSGSASSYLKYLTLPLGKYFTVAQ